MPNDTPGLPEAHAFIATSLDGYIADATGGVDWLVSLPVPEGEDHGYGAFMAGVDGLVMGSGSFRSVLGFGAWPYDKPVVVMSRSMTAADVPPALRGQVRVTDAAPRAVLQALAAQGWRRAYVDGGRLVSSFLRAGLMQRLVVTRVPVLLGAGLPLFADTGPHRFTHVMTRSWPHGFVQSVYQVAA